MIDNDFFLYWIKVCDFITFHYAFSISYATVLNFVIWKCILELKNTI
jgi:hypothetical protein